MTQRDPQYDQQDLRAALSEAFCDLAEQEESAGNIFLAATWRRAAEIAFGFVPRPAAPRAYRADNGDNT